MTEAADIRIELLARLAPRPAVSVNALGAYIEQILLGDLDGNEKQESATELRELFAEAAKSQQRGEATVEAVLESLLGRPWRHANVQRELRTLLARVKKVTGSQSPQEDWHGRERHRRSSSPQPSTI